MRKTRLLLSILLSAALYSVAAFAEESTTSTAVADTVSQESIMPASSRGGMDECPMHKGHHDKCMHKAKGDKFEHNHNEPCPYHQDSSNPHK
jgi:hypothetical protein